jgi:PAS domain S-box-containing protein
MPVYSSPSRGWTPTQFVLDVKTGDLLDVNPAACAFYGYPREAMLRMNVTDLNTLQPAEQAEELAAAALGARAFFGRRQVLASGQSRDVEIHTSLNEIDGRHVLYAIVNDISERKAAEVALRASEEAFRGQYKGFPLPTCSWLHVDDDFVLQEYNDAAEVSTHGRISDFVGKRATDRFVEYPEILADLRPVLQSSAPSDAKRSIATSTRVHRDSWRLRTSSSPRKQ